MTYWKPLLFLFIIIFAGGLVYLYFLTAPSITIPVPVPTKTTSTNSTFGQPAQNVPLPKQISNQTSSPAQFAANFYTWYLQGLMSNQSFSNSNQFKSGITDWLTPDFITNWSTIIENTDMNPVLLAQDYANSWLTNINTSVVTQTATTTTVLVSLGTSSQIHNLTVDLMNIADGTWRIASVTPAP